MSRITKTGLIVFIFALVGGSDLPDYLQVMRAALAAIGLLLFIFWDDARAFYDSHTDK